MATTDKKLVTDNYLIQAENGTFLYSGATGEVHELTDEQVAAITELLAQRQQLGAKLAEVLAEKGLKLGPSIIWDGP